jgi:carboxymethylenebutenolidase
MGGALTIAALVHIPELAAGVCFYGIPPKEFADPAKIKAPFEGHFARQDDWCTPALVDELESTMTAAGAAPEIYRYDAAHAFFNEHSAAYNLACANQAWERTAAFLEKRL